MFVSRRWDADKVLGSSHVWVNCFRGLSCIAVDRAGIFFQRLFAVDFDVTESYCEAVWDIEYYLARKGVPFIKPSVCRDIEPFLAIGPWCSCALRSAGLFSEVSIALGNDKQSVDGSACGKVHSGHGTISSSTQPKALPTDMSLLYTTFFNNSTKNFVPVPQGNFSLLSQLDSITPLKNFTQPTPSTTKTTLSPDTISNLFANSA